MSQWELDAYLAGPGWLSIEDLLVDPRLDPIREDPRFSTVVEKYRRQRMSAYGRKRTLVNG